MRKILALAAGLMLMASVSFAQTAATAASSSSKFEIAPEAGIAIPTSSGLNLGFGGGVFGGFQLDPSLTLGADVAFYTFDVTGSTSSASASSSSLEVTADLKYCFGAVADSIRPFVQAGAGISSYSYSETVAGVDYGGTTYGGGSFSGSTVDPLVLGGVGVDFNAGKDFDIFGVAKANIVLGNGGTFTYIPIEVGASILM